MKAAPYRETFFAKVWGGDQPDEAKMDAWLDSLWNIVKIIKKEYETKGYGEITLPKEQQ
jgi:hypothetical protein